MSKNVQFSECFISKVKTIYLMFLQLAVTSTVVIILGFKHVSSVIVMQCVSGLKSMKNEM